MVRMVTLEFLLLLALLLLTYACFYSLYLLHEEAEWGLKLLNEDPDLLEDANLIADFACPSLALTLPFQDLVLLIIYNQQDSRGVIVVDSRIEPEFLVQRKVWLLDILERDLSLKKRHIPLKRVAVHYEWLTIIIDFEPN